MLNDLRYALRNLRRSPVFTLVALGSLALGIGVNTAIFTLLDQALLRVLPVQHPEQLVLLKFNGVDKGSIRNRDYGGLYFSYPMYRDLRDKNSVFTGVAATAPFDIVVNAQSDAERGKAELVSGNYFGVLGVRPAVGRLLAPSDDLTPGAHPVVVLSHGYWQRRFASDPAVLHRTIRLNGQAFTVVGVAQPGFRSAVTGDAPDIFAPMMMQQIVAGWSDAINDRRFRWLNIIARRKPGVTRRQAEAGIGPLWRALRETELKEISGVSAHFRAEFLGARLTLVEGSRGFNPGRERLSTPLVALMAMVGVVLLMACGNVANLVLARGAARQNEIAVRLALGARRLQIARQLLAESLLLAAGGGALGILLASWITVALLRMLPAESGLGLAFSASPDARVLAFTLFVSLFAGALFGLAPAFAATQFAIAPALKNQAAGVFGGGRQARFRKALVAAQVGLSLLLLVGAGLFARSLYNLEHLDVGFRPDHLLTFRVDPKRNAYTDQWIASFNERLLGALASQPGVRSVACARVALMMNDEAGSGIEIPGYQPKEGEEIVPDMNSVGPGFFSTLGIPLLAGREFTAQDAGGIPKVAVVNAAFERRYFPDQNALGRFLVFGAGHKIEIVGVAANAKYASVRETTPEFLYLPYLQIPSSGRGRMTIYMRTSLDPARLASVVRQQVRRIDADLPVSNLQTMPEQIDENLWLDRIVAALSVSFGLLATVLAAVGLYGVFSYAVARRTREIGIRMALGATREKVIRMVMGEVARLTAVGMAAGIAVSLGLTRFVKSRLFGLANTDPATLAGAAIVLAAVAALAGYLPARRATRVDPIDALRYE